MVKQIYVPIKFHLYNRAHHQISGSLNVVIWIQLYFELWDNKRHQLWEQISRQIEGDYVEKSRSNNPYEI